MKYLTVRNFTLLGRDEVHCRRHSSFSRRDKRDTMLERHTRVTNRRTTSREKPTFKWAGQCKNGQRDTEWEKGGVCMEKTLH